MPLALTLRFDAAAEARLARFETALAAAGFASASRQTGYPPHITLLRVEDAAAEPVLAERLSDLPRLAATLMLSGFGLFPGPPPILFLAPVVTPGLLAFQAALVAALPDVEVHPHTRPGAWVPHVTLAEGAAPALAAALEAWDGPCPVTPVAVELVRFPPARVLGRGPL
ncbi:MULTISPECIES: 2'-5' RNA ligase family protein [Roseomonadaceae]|uniref:2'-5' RNA ligase family protein n=1 Tax=Falsiroseomonas oleicola TaxID=2801474 RepID=A0ABS6HHR7_9PROT|nr:2'-5' RNA ligase family protein [Roseomonas oleicola]MBU8547016.1 2'-5' RNA ligase family protein [Roseomonas oleicola]